MNPNLDFTTSLFNIHDSDIDSFTTRVNGDQTIFEISLKRVEMPCPYCNGPMIGHGKKEKIINHSVLRNQKCVIKYHSNRYICKRCGRTCFEHNPFAFAGFNSSTMLLQDVMNLLGNLNYTLNMISKELHISPTQLNTYLDSFITIPPRPLPENIGIDELHSKALSRKSSSTYLCILVDNDSHNVYDILDSRGKFFLADYLSNIPREERIKVKYVTIDMWEPYRDLASIYFPAASIAVDPFHVIEHLCNDFDRLRISLMKQCDYNSNGYYLLKKWHWLLTKDNVYLDNRKEFNHRFNAYLNRYDIRKMIFDTFPILKTAFELKELYRSFNKESSYEEAVKKYDDILCMFKNSKINEYDEFTGILKHWRNEILNSFLRPDGERKLTNAYTENINGKLRTYLTVSKGVCNFTRFRKRVLFALNEKNMYALTDKLHSEKRKGKMRGPYDKIKD